MLGADSIADQDNSVSVGSSSLQRKIVNVKNGAIKAHKSSSSVFIYVIFIGHYELPCFYEFTLIRCRLYKREDLSILNLCRDEESK